MEWAEWAEEEDVEEEVEVAPHFHSICDEQILFDAEDKCFTFVS